MNIMWKDMNQKMLKYLIPLFLFVSCKTIGINENKCRPLQDNVVLCEDEFYGNHRNNVPLFCRIVVIHKGYKTLTDKFRCEGIYYQDSFAGRKGK